MKSLERKAIYIVPEKPINQEAIAEARFQFTGLTSNHARELRVSASALRDMCAEIGVEKIPVNFTNESVQGLLIIPDATLNDDEWLVGSSDQWLRVLQK